jgi:hypothetical protein
MRLFESVVPADDTDMVRFRYDNKDIYQLRELGARVE